MKSSLNAFIAVGVPAILFLLFLCSLPWVCRHTNFISMLRHHLRRFAPLYFAVGPPAITYFAVCGSASVCGAALFFFIHNNGNISQQYANQHGMYTLFHCIEYGCSFMGALFFAWLIRWVGLARWWTVMLFVSMSLSASYRTARVGTDTIFSSGPEILLSPQWLDAIPVALGLCLYLLLSRNADKEGSAVVVAS